ncbi:ribosome maturation factor RimM [Bacillus carboniphilus]|uniref:Ribosome maturation factor RimM n=1 Tax=Bacillus carboniphilus TaxID=86663 RepID=A0ABY9JVY1_9BACI|nr:ribosome maturation factor RimM [Bacillus carboniphilus]WLR43557.1 ribosome maturation factor RimM [Bacillus carboniphilus]
MKDIKWFNVGKLVNTHGIHGEVRVISVTDFPEERYQKGNRLYLFNKNDSKPTEEVVVHSYRKHKNFYLLTFEGLNNINQVEPFKGMEIKVTQDQLTPLSKNEYYLHEIIGCEVVSEEGKEIGRIKEVLSPGANDVWVIKTASKKEVLIPYIEEVVKEVNIEEKKITIHEMEGLLDE